MPPPATPAATTPATSGESTDGGVGIGQAEALRDVPFSLNTDQPVPPSFVEAYQRRALITVQFYKEGRDPLGYPQGLEVDQRVRTSMERQRSLYPTIEFFSFDISNPGRAESPRAQGARLRLVLTGIARAARAPATALATASPLARRAASPCDVASAQSKRA